jgi:hypothetical protein
VTNALVVIEEIEGELVSSHSVDDLFDVFVENSKAADYAKKKSDSYRLTSDSYRLKAAIALLGIKQLIDAGLNGDQCEFWQWFDEIAGRSRRDGERLLAIAQAADPVVKLIEDKAKNADHNRAYRARKALELADLRKRPLPPHREAENSSTFTGISSASGTFEAEKPAPAPVSRKRLASHIPEPVDLNQLAAMDEIERLFQTLTMANRDVMLIRIRKIIRA